MLEHWARRLDKDVRAFGAGSSPRGRVYPCALQVLNRASIDTGDARIKPWDEFAAPGARQMRVVITVCDSAAAETYPLSHVYRGVPVPTMRPDMSRRLLAEGLGISLALSCGFGDVLQQLDEYTRDLVIGCSVEDVLAFLLRPHEPRGSQQPKVVADQGWAEPQPMRDVRHGSRSLETGQHDAQARCIAKQSKHVGQFGYVALGGHEVTSVTHEHVFT